MHTKEGDVCGERSYIKVRDLIYIDQPDNATLGISPGEFKINGTHTLVEGNQVR